MARPALSESDRKDHVIMIRLTAEQHSAIKTLAEEQHRTISNYVRDIVLTQIEKAQA